MKKVIRIVPQLDSPVHALFQFGGVMGERLEANQRNWLMVAPIANPSMVEMFRDRDEPGGDPSCRLLWWSGEFAGKYLTSGVQGLRISRDPHLRETLQSFVNELNRYQAPAGYLGPFEHSKRMTGRDCGNQPLWDLWGQYHCMLGLYLWHRETGDSIAMQACLRAADFFCRFFIDDGNPVDAAGAPAMNQACAHIFALLYQETGEPRYLQMVQAVERAWVTSGGNYVEGFQQGESFFQGRQPRWESLHAVQAVAELYFITGEERYRRAFTQIWRSIRERDRHITGGFTSLEQATGNPYDPRPIETCGTVAWMALTLDMLRMTGDSVAADELELSTWNAMLGAQHPDGRWWTYNTPMGGVPTQGMSPMGAPPPMNDVPWFLGERVPTRFDLGFQDRLGASYLSCCAASGPRGLGIVSEWAVMTAIDGLTLNFYGPSTFVARVPSGQNVRLTQSTSYPADGGIRLVVTPDRNEQFTLRLRIPGWSQTTRVVVNGQAQPNPSPGSYLSLNRVWRSCDTVDLTLDLSPRVLMGGPRPPDSRTDGSTEGKLAVYRGPLLLAYDARFDTQDPAQLPAILIPLASRPISVNPFPVDSDSARPLLLIRFATATGDTITLCDFASAGHSSALLVCGPPDTAGKTWQFRRANGTVLADRISLLPNGTIGGSTHPNESRWRIEGDTLVFLSQDGTPSTRFVWTAIENGRMILRGRFAFGRNIIHELSELNLEVTDKVWQFGRARTDGTVETLVPKMRLLRDFTILGSTHTNESRWRMEGETLVFCAANGTPTTLFEKVATEHGRMVWRGRFVFDQRITHVLSELDLEVRNKIWQFHSSSYPVSLRLLPDFTIDGSIHPNETRWGFEGDNLVFYTREGAASTRFTTTRVENGLMALYGDFEFDQRIKHKLMEWTPDLGWVLGSHYISWLPAPL